LDGSDSSSTDAADNIVLDTAIDFSNNDIVITDSGGASATIVKADIATATSGVDVSTTVTGQYAGIGSLLGEDLNRIQDSYYYQDFSYEIQVGQALSTYLSELKKAVHPVGFLPFGKVSIATAVSAAVTTTAAGVSGFTGDDRFSPILASVLETLFDQTVQSRLQATPTTYGIGQSDDQIVLENGIVAGDNIVFDATDSLSTDAGSNILLEPVVIVLNGTDSDGSNAGDQLLLTEKVNLVLNGTDSDGTADTDGNVLLETGDAVLIEEEGFIVIEESGEFGVDLEDGVLEAILYESR
jgi:hypothetical protein